MNKRLYLTMSNNRKDKIYLNYITYETRNILKGFFKKIGLNNIFNHLFDINIYIDYDNKYTSESLALYSLDANIINDEFDYEETLDDFNDEPKYEKIYINYEYFNQCRENREDSKLILTLIHELIHKNRSLLVKSENTANNYNKIYRYKTNNDEFKSKYDISLLKKTLDDYISSHKECSGKVLLSFLNGKESYKIYYDFDRKFFDIYDDNNNLIDRYDDNLSLNYEDKVYLAADYYTIKDDNGINLLFDKRKMYDYMDYQTSMEEALTEAVARIIYTSKNQMNFDLNECCKIVENTDNLDVKAAILLFKTYGIDLFNWFILSTYEDEYSNMISDIFNDDYENIIGLFDVLYKHNNPDAYDGIVDLINTNKIKR